MGTWPYFRSKVSRYAIERAIPVPVVSCWNGMGKYITHRTAHPSCCADDEIVAMPIAPFLTNPPFRFRSIHDSLAQSHVEGSECCLIHADNPLSATSGVFLNPNVKVGYNGSVYDAVHSPDAVMSPFQIYTAVWENRLRRWFSTPWLKEWEVRKRVRKWSRQTGEEERGGHCLVNEMQVIFDRGWKHV